MAMKDAMAKMAAERSKGSKMGPVLTILIGSARSMPEQEKPENGEEYSMESDEKDMEECPECGKETNTAYCPDCGHKMMAGK